MYKFKKENQISFTDFNQTMGLHMNPNNRWVKGKQLKQYHYPDEEPVEQIRENPYYQYFIGLPGYEDKIPFVPSLLAEFRNKLSEDVLNEINEMIIEYNSQQDDEYSDD